LLVVLAPLTSAQDAIQSKSTRSAPSPARRLEKYRPSPTVAAPANSDTRTTSTGVRQRMFEHGFITTSCVFEIVDQ